MQQINESKLKVTGRVIGIIKKFSKTYGGSIIGIDQMLPQTKDKFFGFAKVNNVSERDLMQFYRVFVPYNNQLPQVLVKTNAPDAISNKRLIIRIQRWPLSSPFPFGQFVKIIGIEGKIRTETDMILHEFNVDTRPFS